MVDRQEDITGSVICACHTHFMTIEAYADEEIPHDLREVALVMWNRQGGNAPYHYGLWYRIRQAWGWLRGRPDACSSILLNKIEMDRLRTAIDKAIVETWPE